MTGSQTFPRMSRQVIEEHGQIHFFLDRLSSSLSGWVDGPGGVEAMRRLAAQIDGLRERLIEHFGGEEAGLFRAVTDLLPECQGDVEDLARQHARVLELLEMSRIRAQYGELSERRTLERDLQAFLTLLRDHERREESLLLRAQERERQA